MDHQSYGIENIVAVDVVVDDTMHDVDDVDVADDR